MKEVHSFNFEESLVQNRWIGAGSNLVVIPKELHVPHCLRVLDRRKAVSLERPPSTSELYNFDSIIVIENGTLKQGEDLRRQSLWVSNSLWASMGIIFPRLRQDLVNFHTLQGLLYPDTTILRQDSTVLETNSTTSFEKWLEAVTQHKVWCLTRILSPRKQAKSLEAILQPETNTHRLGIWGIGDIGTVVAAFIRTQDISESGISEIFIGGSRKAEKVEYQRMELEDMNFEGVRQPIVYEVLPGNEEVFFQECDVILILVASGIRSPQETTDQHDVRSEQFERNMPLLKDFVSHATSQYDGQILIGSDPVEQLTMGLYLEMQNKGVDINTHQFAGFGGMINRSRAKTVAEKYLNIPHFRETGRTFGPHGKMMVAFPTHNLEYYNARQAELLSIETGHRNYYARERLAKPHLGPAVLIAHGLLGMYRENENSMERIIYASPFIPSNDSSQRGDFFGGRVIFHPFPRTWTPKVDQPFLQQIMDVLERSHRWVEETSYNPTALRIDPFTDGISRHPAFHPYMMEQWLEKVKAEER